MNKMSETGRYFYLVVTLLSITGCRALTCYHCSKMTLEDDSSDAVKQRYKGGITNSNPDCGLNPSPKNTLVCSAAEVCEAIISDETATLPGAGNIHFRFEVLDCRSGVSDIVDSCKKLDSDVINDGIQQFGTLRDIQLDMKACACNTDLCVPGVCNGGTVISGRCSKYWIIGLSVAAVAIVIILITTSCCFCCGCCTKARQNINGMNPFNGINPSPVELTTTSNAENAGYDQPQHPNTGQGPSYLHVNPGNSQSNSNPADNQKDGIVQGNYVPVKIKPNSGMSYANYISEA